MKIQIIQVPYDSGYRDLRQGCGPAHFIDQNLDGMLEADGHQVRTTRIDAKAEFTTEIGTAFELNRLLSVEVKAAVESGSFPIVLAGNCNSCLGTIAGIGSAKLGVIWLDAHGEFNTNRLFCISRLQAYAFISFWFPSSVNGVFVSEIHNLLN